MSYAMYMSSTVLSAAKYFQSKNGGGVLAMSSGNSGGPWSSSWTSYALVVGATDPYDNLSYYSTTGAMVSLTAPGDSIYTTANGGGYRYGTGTSFSSPIVAGVAALVFSVNPKLSGTQVQNILEKTADDLGPAGWDSSFGYGRVNAANAVAMALSSSSTATSTSTSPTISFSSPSNGGTISGTSTISVSASDSAGIASVSLSVDGSPINTDTASPYNFSLTTTAFSNGSHTLTGTAVDALGNTSSASITVTVSNLTPTTTPVTADTVAPTVNFVSPTNGAVVSGNVSISVSASDNVGVTKMQLFIDGSLVASSTSGTLSARWNGKATATPHILKATASDAAGNVGVVQISVTR
jgi:hypothetical protein